MADLGAIAKTNTTLGLCRVFPLHRAASLADAVSDLSGMILGVITESGNPVPYARVHLHYRVDGSLIGRTFTGVDGSYSFSGLDPNTSEYYVVALDPAGGTVYNDVIRSLITPG